MNKTYDNFDNPNTPWNTDIHMKKGFCTNPNYVLTLKRQLISCDYFSLMLTDDTVSDFTDCRAHETNDSIEILTKDNTMVVYYRHVIKGYTYKLKTYIPHTDC